jgi:hypothetical protein
MAQDAQNAQQRMQARQAIAGDDPVAQLQLQLEQESALLTQYALLDLANAQLYADAKVALAQQTADRIAEINQRERDQQKESERLMVALAADSAAEFYQILVNAGRERTALGKALFATQKALAVAEIIMNTEIAASKAYAQFGVYGAAAATAVRVAGYASAGIVAGQAIGELTSGGRQYGGPVSAGNLYRVNETGRPEMFTAANGSQYMLPTKSGDVTAANKVSAAAAPQLPPVVQHFHFASQPETRTIGQVGAAAARGLSMAGARNN